MKTVFKPIEYTRQGIANFFYSDTDDLNKSVMMCHGYQRNKYDYLLVFGKENLSIAHSIYLNHLLNSR